MPNFFITRERFGRWKFVSIVIIYYIVANLATFYISAAFFDAEKDPLNPVVGTFGVILMLAFIESISNWNFALMNQLLDKGIIVEDKEEIAKKLKKVLWHNQVYALFAAFYIIIVIFSAINAYFEIISFDDFLTAFATQIVLALLLAELCWVIVVPVAIILWLPRQKISLDIFDSDGLSGLGPIANYLLKISLLITLLGASMLYWLSQIPLLYAFLLLLGVICAPILYFIFPTIGLNKTMRKTKYHALDKLNGNLREIYEKISSSSTKPDWGDTSLQNLLLLIREVEKKREWPFSIRGTRNLSASFLIPIGIFIFNNIQEILDIFGF